MLDLALFTFVMAFLALGFARPFLWVLAYIYIDILAPQKIGWTLTPMFSISLIAFVAAFAGWLATDPKRSVRVHYRQVLMLVLLGWAFVTLQWSPFPEAAATKWDWVWRALVFAIFLPFTLTTRNRIEATVLTIVLTAGAIIIATGLKTLGGGGGYESLYFFVNDNSNIYESSTLATVAIGLIPLIVWLTRHGTIFRPSRLVSLFAAGLIFACLLVPIGTEARTGLIAIAVLGVLLLREAKNRFAYLFAAVALGLVALPFLPASYYERMATITGYAGDSSASTRLAVWSWTMDYVAEHPLGGGFDIYRANSVTYDMPVRTVDGSTVTIQTERVTDEARAFHSSYFELLGEQGWPGFLAWMALQLSGLVQMERLRRRYRGSGGGESWIAPLAAALQNAHIVYLVGAAFQGIGYQPVVFLFLGLQIGLWNWVRRYESPQMRETGEAGTGARTGRRSPRSRRPVPARAAIP